MITTLDRTNLRELRADIDAALKVVADRHGISITTGSCTFLPQNAKLKVVIATKNSDGVVESPYRTDFKRCAFQYGLKPEDIGREFECQGMRFKIEGCKIKAYSKPILCKQVSTGKLFKFSAETVCQKLTFAARA